MENKQTSLGEMGDILETTEEYINTKLNIFNKNSPYFFIKNSKTIKNYRVSISFEFLNKKHGLSISIIRDFNKIKDIDKLHDYINYLKIYDYVEELDTGSKKNSMTFDIYKYSDYSDTEPTGTSIFYLNKLYRGELSSTIVFFSKKFSNINKYIDYLDTKRK